MNKAIHAGLAAFAALSCAITPIAASAQSPYRDSSASLLPLHPSVPPARGGIPLFQRSFHLAPFWTSLLLVGVIFICVLPAYWSTGILGQHRTLNVAYILFIPLWFINLMAWADTAMGRRAEQNAQRHLGLRWPFLLVFLVLLWTMRNGGHATTDLVTGRAERFDRQLQQRYDLLEHARSTGEEPILHSPRIGILRKACTSWNSDQIRAIG